MIAAAIGASVLEHASWGVFGVIFRNVSDDRDLWTSFADISGLVSHAVTVVYVTGAVLCATASKPPSRGWFAASACAAAASMCATWLVPWALAAWNMGDFSTIRWVWRLGIVLWLATAATFALASREKSTSSSLRRGMLVAVGVWIGVYLLAQALAHDPLEAAPRWLALALDLTSMIAEIAWVFVALEQLGAFPESAASLRTRARSAAGIAAVAVCLVGIAVAASAVWVTRYVSSAEPTRDALTTGIVTFAAGAFALRGRRSALVPAIAVTIVLVVVGRLVLGSSARPVADVALAPVRVPRLAVSLPEGTVERKPNLREQGRLTVMTRHADLGLVTLSWYTTHRDPIEDVRNATQGELVNVPFTETLGGRRIEGTLWKLRNITELYATWQCGDLYYLLQLSRYTVDDGALPQIAHRILETASCQPPAADDAPALAIAFTPPPGFHDVSKHPHISVFENDAQEAYSFIWSGEDDYVDALATAPEKLFAAVHAQDAADRATPLPELHIPEREDSVESSTRRVLQIDYGDTRILVTAWRCFSLDVDFVGYYSGRASAEAAEKVLASARCP